MTFPSLDPNTNDVTITFSTTKPDCLLVYNYGAVSGGRSDFIAVELVEGRARAAGSEGGVVRADSLQLFHNYSHSQS